MSEGWTKVRRPEAGEGQLASHRHTNIVYKHAERLTARSPKLGHTRRHVGPGHPCQRLLPQLLLDPRRTAQGVSLGRASIQRLPF